MSEPKKTPFYELWEQVKDNLETPVVDVPDDDKAEVSILDIRPQDFHLKIALIGDGAVGKTTLRKRYLGEKFSETYYQTIGADFAVHESNVGSHKVKYVIWDLAGQLRFHEVRKLFYQGVHGALVVFDISNQESFNNIQHWINELWKNSGLGAIPFVLVGNKSDLRDNIGIQSVSDDVIQNVTNILSNETIKRYGFRIKSIITSAKTGENVSEAFKRLAIQIIVHKRFLISQRGIHK